MKGALKQIFFDPFQEEFKNFDTHFNQVMSSDIKLVDQIAKYIVKHKGKQFRPALVLVSARTLGAATNHTYTIAAVVELLHTATLVHDDVLDDSDLRRGVRTIHKIWKNKASILMGDYLLSKSLIAATETGSIEVMNIVATVAKRLIKGAMFEVQKARSLDVSIDDYFRMIADKTASLISACCELGALSVNSTKEEQIALRDFGENLGLAFQIKDDLLDYQGSSGVLGKPALADLEDKKITLPLLYAFQEASDKEQKSIYKIVKNGTARKNIGLILDFVNRYQGLEKATQKAQEIKDEAIAALKVLPDTPAKESLTALADFVVNRNK